MVDAELFSQLLLSKVVGVFANINNVSFVFESGLLMIGARFL